MDAFTGSRLPPAAILAGGLATRLRPLTQHVPKSLLEINGRPFIAHQLELLRACGITRVVICAGFLGEQIVRYVQDGQAFGIDVRYSFDGDRLLGTGGALRRALPHLGPEFFVLYGDSYLPCNYAAVFQAFRKSSGPGLMTVFRNENAWDRSNVEFAGGRIRAYCKQQRTPAMRHIDYGLGVFRRTVFDEIPDGACLDLSAIYQKLLFAGQLTGYEVSNRFYEVGSRQGMADLSHYLKKRPPATSRRAVFLDRDGVLNTAIVREGKPFPPRSMEEFQFIPGVKAALQELKDAGFLLIVVTNQPDVARGRQSRETVERMHRHLRAELPVDEVLVCWHDDGANCDCRKPRPGLLLAAAQDFGIDPGKSFLIGDRWRDIEAAHRAGCAPVWIDHGYAEQKPAIPPAFTGASIHEAVQWILAQ